MADLVKNRKAYHEFEILETYEVGIELVGTEVKSLRENNAHLAESYVRLIKDELWLVGSSIALYKHGNIHNHEEKRTRKLLMHYKEIQKLKAFVKEKGNTLVPLAFYLKGGKVKLKIGRAKGKKLHDKRQSIKERDVKRRMDKIMKGK